MESMAYHQSNSGGIWAGPGMEIELRERPPMGLYVNDASEQAANSNGGIMPPTGSLILLACWRGRPFILAHEQLATSCAQRRRLCWISSGPAETRHEPGDQSRDVTLVRAPVQCALAASRECGHVDNSAEKLLAFSPPGDMPG